jgi:hypothetical protein
MANILQYAVLQKDPVRPTPEQMKQAFKAFRHLTDADAVRLAVGARGILMRHLGSQMARAVQRALQAAGVAVSIVPERDLPRLPEGLSLQRLEVWPQALTVYDPLNRPTTIAWEDITLIATGAALHFDLNRTQTELARRQHTGANGVSSQTRPDSGHSIAAGCQLLLEIILDRPASRYQIDAAEFRFKHLIDRPGLSIEEKFIWLVRELRHHAPRAILNAGARRLQEGEETVPIYTYRQVLTDEIVWLLWHRSQPQPL